MVCISMIRLRKKKPDEKDFFKLRFGYYFATAGILFSLWLLTASKITELRDVSICIFIGIVFYVVYEWTKKQSVKRE